VEKEKKELEEEREEKGMLHIKSIFVSTMDLDAWSTLQWRKGKGREEEVVEEVEVEVVEKEEKEEEEREEKLRWSTFRFSFFLLPPPLR